MEKKQKMEIKTNWLNEFKEKVVVLRHRLDSNKSITLIGTLQILDNERVRITHSQRGSIVIRQATIENIVLYNEGGKRK